VLVDALRPHEATGLHPGEAALRVVDIIVVNKVGAAAVTDIDTLIDEVRRVTPHAHVVRAALLVTLANHWPHVDRMLGERRHPAERNVVT
jgi:predicted GTPase